LEGRVYCHGGLLVDGVALGVLISMVVIVVVDAHTVVGVVVVDAEHGCGRWWWGG
jgi:hypothetical protein